MATVSMVVRHLLDREGTALVDGELNAWVESFSALLKEQGHCLEIVQEGAGWNKVLPGGELIHAVPEQNPDACFQPNLSQYVWERGAAISFAVYADPLLVYPQAHSRSVILGQSIPTMERSADSSTEQLREEWRARIKAGLAAVNCVAANNTQFIQWAVSTWPGLAHKLHYIPDWLEPVLPAGDMSTGNSHNSPVAAAPPRILFPCPALPRFGVSETLRAVEVLCRNQKEMEFCFCGAVNAHVRRQMQRWFDEHPCCRLMPPGEPAYGGGDIALFPVKSGPVPVQQVLRAMRSGAAVIGSMHGPLVDMIIHTHNGLLVKPADSDLIESLELLLDSDDLRWELGGRARLTGAVQSKQSWVAGWRALLKRLQGRERDG